MEPYRFQVLVFRDIFIPSDFRQLMKLHRMEHFFKNQNKVFTLSQLFTPVNLNINIAAGDSKSNSATAFSAFMIDTAVGGGYDYPIAANMVISTELLYRFASAQERNSATTVSYSGLGIMIGYTTSYH